MNTLNSVKKAVRIIERKNTLCTFAVHKYLSHSSRISKIKINEKIKKSFPKAVIGLSDHTQNNYCSYAALGLGASIIEKHFIDTKNRKGPDISASMDTQNFKDLIGLPKLYTLHSNIMVQKNNKTRDNNFKICLCVCSKH